MHLVPNWCRLATKMVVTQCTMLCCKMHPWCRHNVPLRGILGLGKGSEQKGFTAGLPRLIYCIAFPQLM